MVVTSATSLPTEEELTVTEINLSGAALRAGAFHMGKHCENQNNVSKDDLQPIFTIVFAEWFIY